jgi:pimeloyl-ACP methyl ester carboxylesterase
MLPHLRGEIWTWNPPGYGGSGGKASLERIADAAIGFWYQVTERQANPDTRILLCGNSLGCVTALRVAASSTSDHHRTGLILRNPPPLIPVVKHVADQYPLSRWVGTVAESLCDPMNAVITASQVRCPAVFLQSELDTLVPPPLQRQVIDAYAGDKKTVVLGGLSHGGLPVDSHELDMKQAIDWLWNQVARLP